MRPINLERHREADYYWLSVITEDWMDVSENSLIVHDVIHQAMEKER